MLPKRLWITALLAVITLVAGAAAQNNELAGGLGRTFIADQGIRPGPVPLTNNTVHFGNGLSFEINYARRILTRTLFALDAEVPFVGNPDEDLGSGNGAVPSQYSAYFITPAARFKLFPATAIQPWVSFGGGFGHFHMSNTLVYGGANPGPRIRNSGLLQGGVGLDVRPWTRIGLRLAARDFISDALPLNVNTGRSNQHNIVVTGGIVWSF